VFPRTTRLEPACGGKPLMPLAPEADKGQACLIHLHLLGRCSLHASNDVMGVHYSPAAWLPAWSPL